MLGLKLPTDPRWVKLVEGNISEILTDHAWCEQKAASNAISTIVRFPELTDLVEELTRIAQEEMEHFGMVVEKIKARGWTLGYERKDDYVGQLSKIIKRGGSLEEQLVDRVRFAAMIDARSCERVKMLSEPRAVEERMRIGGSACSRSASAQEKSWGMQFPCRTYHRIRCEG